MVAGFFSILPNHATAATFPPAIRLVLAEPVQLVNTSPAALAQALVPAPPAPMPAPDVTIQEMAGRATAAQRLRARRALRVRSTQDAVARRRDHVSLRPRVPHPQAIVRFLRAAPPSPPTCGETLLSGLPATVPRARCLLLVDAHLVGTCRPAPALAA